MTEMTDGCAGADDGPTGLNISHRYSGSSPRKPSNVNRFERSVQGGTKTFDTGNRK